MKTPIVNQMLTSATRFDHTVFGWWHASEHRHAVPAARSFSRSADGWLYALFPLLYVVSDPDAAYGFCAAFAVAIGVERLLYTTLKKTFKRRRPPELWPGFNSIVVASDRFSLPSGHTSAAFLFANACALEFGLVAAIILYPWAVIVGASRVILGVHFPTDIVAGAVLGSSVAAAVLL